MKQLTINNFYEDSLELNYLTLKAMGVQKMDSHNMSNYLIFCCQKDNLEQIKQIIKTKQFKENPEMIHVAKDKPFAQACVYNNIQVVDYLLKHTNKNICMYSDQNLIKGILLACYHGHLKLLKYLLSYNLNDKENEKLIVYDNTLLFANFREKLNKFSMAKELLEECTKENIGFLLACKEGHKEIAEFLLTNKKIKTNANINCLNGLSFNLACYSLKLDIIQLLLTDNKLEEKYLIKDNNGYFSYLLSVRNNEMIKKIIHYLIMDYQIELTIKIKKSIKNKPEIKKLFDTRDTFNKLNKNLTVSLKKEKTIKKI